MNTLKLASFSTLLLLLLLLAATAQAHPVEDGSSVSNEIANVNTSCACMPPNLEDLTEKFMELNTCTECFNLQKVEVFDYTRLTLAMAVMVTTNTTGLTNYRKLNESCYRTAGGTNNHQCSESVAIRRLGMDTFPSHAMEVKCDACIDHCPRATPNGVRQCPEESACTGNCYAQSLKRNIKVLKFRFCDPQTGEQVWSYKSADGDMEICAACNCRLLP